MTNQLEQQVNVEDTNNTSDKDIFDAAFSTLADQFGKFCESNGCILGYMVTEDPITKKSYLYTIGHAFDVGCLMNKVTVNFKTDLHEQLET